MKRYEAVIDYWLAVFTVLAALAAAASFLGCNSDTLAGPTDDYSFRVSYAADDYVRVYWKDGPPAKTYYYRGNVTWTSRNAWTWVRLEANNPNARIKATLYINGVEKVYDYGTGAVQLTYGAF